jgi:hypothetical protein
MTTSTESAQRRASDARGRIPDFFIVGHPKSGTTALYEMLRAHPRIHMPVKEPQFFAPEMLVRAPPAQGVLPRTLEDYMRLYDDAGEGQLIGEASPSYLRSLVSAELIAQANPTARVIAILREPASFLHSLHLQFVQAIIETEYDFATALALEEDRRSGRAIAAHSYWPHALLYSDHVRYVQQLRRFHDVLPPERVLVLIYDDFRADNEATVRRVLRFLDVDEHVEIEATEANPTVSARSPRLHELVHAVSVGRGPLSRTVKTAVKTLTPDGPRRRALRATREHLLYQEPPPPDPALMEQLRRRFKAEVVSVSEYLDRDLVSLWGYDRLT